MTLKKILIVGPAWIGDMVMAQSLFKILKHQDPNVMIDVLAPDWTKPLLNRMQEVRHAKGLSIPHGKLELKTRFALAQQLKIEHYDQAIILPNSWKSALIPVFAKIPKRTGFLGEMRWGLLNDVRLLDKKIAPQMRDRFAILGYSKDTDFVSMKNKIPLPALQVSQNEVTKSLSKFHISNVSTSASASSAFSTTLSATAPKQSILALCPGAEYGVSKRWPEHYFAQVANEKLNENGQVWLFGSKKDEESGSIIQKLTSDRCHNFIGKTTLDEAIDLLSCVDTVLTNDSGLMHVAAALNKPLLAIYGSTDPHFTPPLHKKAKIARIASLSCSPCFKRKCPLKHHACMLELTPQSILKTLNALEEECVH